MAMPFIVGMKVQLKSGGPMMTIQSVDADAANCIWFDKGTLRNAEFLPDTLVEATDIVGTVLARLNEETKRLKPRADVKDASAKDQKTD